VASVRTSVTVSNHHCRVLAHSEVVMPNIDLSNVD
jgi:hypothetical protein